MDFSGLRKKNESAELNNEMIKINKLVVVADYYSAKACEILLENEKDFHIIGERPIDLIDASLKGPSTYRIASDIADAMQVTSSVFYKEQKFRSFNGRSRPMELKAGEKYFTFPKINTINEPISKDVIEQINRKMITKKITKFHVNKESIFMETGDGQNYEVSELYWPLGVMPFIDLLENKYILSENALSSLSNFQGPVPLYIHLTINKAVDFDKTLFLPVSQTHEQGHFIGDIEKINEKKSSLNFVHFIDPVEVNEDHVCRLIKNLKRQIERVYELNSSHFVEENISLSPLPVASLVDDELTETFEKTIKPLKLIGEQFLHHERFADSCSGWQSGFRGQKSLECSVLSR